MVPGSSRNVSRNHIAQSVFLLCIMIFLTSSQGEVINARSCSQSDVQEAISSASPGDIIFLPSGSSTWSGSLIIDKSGITIQGSGVGSTIISGGNKIILLSGENANRLRITGIEFRSCSQCIYAGGSGTPRQAVKNFRIDHSKFINSNVVLETTGGATGVIDSCLFVDTYAARLYGSNDVLAEPPYELGTSDAVFFEDNTITVTSGGNPRHFLASNSHSKYVVRHNTFNYGASLWDIVDAHGACEVLGRGSATWEIYDNTFNLVPWISRVIHLRGGQGVVFNNTFTNYKPSKPITITDYALCNPPCTQSCTSYPCPDQINHSYFWNNKIEDVLVDPVNNCSEFIKLDTNYYTYPMPGYTPYTYPHPLTNSERQFSTGIKKDKAAVKNVDFTITPNAFNSGALISYVLKERASVKIAVYSVNGSLIRTLVDEIQASGKYSLNWSGANATKGLYILKTSVGKAHKSFTLTR